jgi:hypothetical protein
VAVLFCPDGGVVSAGRDGLLITWRAGGSAATDQLDLSSAHDRPVSLAQSPDGKTLLVGTHRGVILRFDRR